jgi:hypothetical protein
MTVDVTEHTCPRTGAPVYRLVFQEPGDIKPVVGDLFQEEYSKPLQGNEGDEHEVRSLGFMTIDGLVDGFGNTGLFFQYASQGDCPGHFSGITSRLGAEGQIVEINTSYDGSSEADPRYVALVDRLEKKF